MSREALFALALTALVTFPSGARAQGGDCASSKSMPLTRHCYSLRYQGSLISCVLCSASSSASNGSGLRLMFVVLGLRAVDC